MSLKTKNTPILVGFVLTEAALIAFMVGASAESLPASFSKLSALGATAAATAAVTVLSETLGDRLKARLTFWKWRHPLPGCVAFTTYIVDDADRIDLKKLKSRYGSLPSKPEDQNRLWL